MARIGNSEKEATHMIFIYLGTWNCAGWEEWGKQRPINLQNVEAGSIRKFVAHWCGYMPLSQI
jgi:hypothetical protein